jgi:hypothetical protein
MLAFWHLLLYYTLGTTPTLSKDNIRYVCEKAVTAFNRSVPQITNMLLTYIFVMIGCAFVLFLNGNVVLGIFVLIVYILDVISRLLLCVSVIKLRKGES